MSDVINHRQNLTFLFRPRLPGNKLNSKTITSHIVMLMRAANIWSCKDTLVCCCERWAHTIQDCTALTWVDYCQLGEDCSFSPDILKLQGSCCLKFVFVVLCSMLRAPVHHSLWGSGQWTAQMYRHVSTSSSDTSELVCGKYQLFVYCRYTTNYWYLEL